MIYKILEYNISSSLSTTKKVRRFCLLYFYTTTSVDDDGILNALHHFGLI